MTLRMLITGGAGFIGINAALFFARAGWEVAVIDNLSRRGALENLEWLRTRVHISFIRADVRDAKAVEKAFQEFAGLEAVLHLTAQVAVTTAVQDPRADFEINVLGTLNVLEALRKHAPEASLIFASTNKVYGKMDELDVVLDGARYRFSEAGLAIDESRPLDFHSPYRCSKGAADQYVLDYARIYGLRTVSFRQSCIYGPYQFGIEDQGWVAWFAIAAFLGVRLRYTVTAARSETSFTWVISLKHLQRPSSGRTRSLVTPLTSGAGTRTRCRCSSCSTSSRRSLVEASRGRSPVGARATNECT